MITEVLTDRFTRPSQTICTFGHVFSQHPAHYPACMRYSPILLNSARLTAASAGWQLASTAAAAAAAA